jgi:uncharacterized protein
VTRTEPIVKARNETVLVTGASSGLGLELADLFARDGADLILVARRLERLEEVAERLTTDHGVRTLVIPMDLSEPGSVDRLAESIHEMGLQVDVLVNSAGFGARGPFAAMPADRVGGMLEVNIGALTNLTRHFLPGMIERGRGGVINLGSLAGFLPGALMTTYYASKAYVLAFSEALSEEVRGTGVTVCCVAPGPTDTGFVEAAEIEGIRFFRLGAMDARSVAETGYRAFRKGNALSLPGASTRAAAFLLRFSPRALTRRVGGWMNR